MPFPGALLWCNAGQEQHRPRAQPDFTGGLWQVPAAPPGAVPAPLTIPCFPLVQSLDWETFEQYCTWQLFLAHSIPLETIIPILQHLKYKGELSPAREGRGAGPRWPRAPPVLSLSFPLQSTPRRYPACCCS